MVEWYEKVCDLIGKSLKLSKYFEIDIVYGKILKYNM